MPVVLSGKGTYTLLTVKKLMAEDPKISQRSLQNHRENFTNEVFAALLQQKTDMLKPF